MSTPFAFEMDPDMVVHTHVDVRDGEFDISNPMDDAETVEYQTDIIGYARLAKVDVPVMKVHDGVAYQRFHVFGVPEGAPMLTEAVPSAMESGQQSGLLPQGSIAVIDSPSLNELICRARMSPDRLDRHVRTLAAAASHGALVPSIHAVHALPGAENNVVVVGRGFEEGVEFSSLLARRELSRASKKHFSAIALDSLHAALRVHATYDTIVTHSR